MHTGLRSTSLDQLAFIHGFKREPQHVTFPSPTTQCHHHYLCLESTSPNLTLPVVCYIRQEAAEFQLTPHLLDAVPTTVNTLPNLSPPTPFLFYFITSNTKYIKKCKSILPHTNLRWKKRPNPRVGRCVCFQWSYFAVIFSVV